MTQMPSSFFTSLLLILVVFVATNAALPKELTRKKAAEDLCAIAKKGEKPTGMKHGDANNWYAAYDIAPYIEKTTERNEDVTYKVRFELTNCGSKKADASPTIVRCTLLCDDQVSPTYTKPNACGQGAGTGQKRTEYSMHENENAKQIRIDTDFEIDYEVHMKPVLYTQQDKADYKAGKKKDSIEQHKNVKQRLTCINWEPPTFTLN